MPSRMYSTYASSITTRTSAGPTDEPGKLSRVDDRGGRIIGLQTKTNRVRSLMAASIASVVEHVVTQAPSPGGSRHAHL